MKIVISLKPLKSGSKTRGVGVYTRELIRALKEKYQEDSIIATSKDYYGKDVDLVHFPFFDPFFLTLPFWKSKPTIVTVHDLIPLKFPKHFPRGIRGSIKWFIQKSSLKNVKSIITDSNSSKKDIVELLKFPENRIHVIPLGPSLVDGKINKKLEKETAEEYNLAEKFILYVGDLNWNKNIPYLINEYAALKSKNLHLVIVGKAFKGKVIIPELKAILRAIEKNSVQGKVHMLGHVPDKYLPSLYALATLYVQPSLYEGFGLPVLEAMVCGCPVLTSNTSSLSEVGGNAVEYFNPSKTGELSSKLRLLLSNPTKLKKLSTLGKQQAKQFTWQKTAEMTRKVYQKVASK